ncbi:MAG: hypothetical protein ACTHWA_02850 [Arachnia sp.]
MGGAEVAIIALVAILPLGDLNALHDRSGGDHHTMQKEDWTMM